MLTWNSLGPIFSSGYQRIPCLPAVAGLLCPTLTEKTGVVLPSFSVPTAICRPSLLMQVGYAWRQPAPLCPGLLSASSPAPQSVAALTSKPHRPWGTIL